MDKQLLFSFCLAQLAVASIFSQPATGLEKPPVEAADTIGKVLKTDPARAAGREGGLYLGAYVFPLFRRDWGFVAAMQTRKLLLEASWQKCNHNRDYLLDQQLKGVENAIKEKVYWDGYYAHFAINGLSRKRGKRGNRSYMGALLGYNVREFETIISNVSDGNNTFVGIHEFNPAETRYILMLNMGQHLNGRLLAADVYFSLGGTYDEFTRGNEMFDAGNYSFERTLLKRKDTRFGFMMRIGITMGLQFGPRTFRR